MRTIPLILALCLGACLPHTEYVPKSPGVAALAIKGGKLAVVKDGRVVNGDGFEDILRCDPAASELGQSSHRHLKSAERNASIAGAINALTVFFPLAPAIGAIFMARSADQDAKGTADLVDAMNQHNDAATCAAGGPR